MNQFKEETAWTKAIVSADGTHHVIDDVPIYSDRYDRVQKFHAPGLAPVRCGREAWHILPDGSSAYIRRFEQTFGFYEERAAVVEHGVWYHILKNGVEAYPRRFAWCGNFQEGRCPVRDKDGTYFHIDHKGYASYKERWRYAGDYRDGIAVVQAADGRSTHIDQGGCFLHAKWFIDLDVFHKDFARARDQSGWMHIDRSGIPVYERRFSMVEPFYNGQARVERFDGGLEIIDESGEAIIEIRPSLPASNRVNQPL